MAVRARVSWRMPPRFAIVRLLGHRRVFGKELPGGTSGLAAVAERHGLPPGLAQVMRVMLVRENTEPGLVRVFIPDRWN